MKLHAVVASSLALVVLTAAAPAQAATLAPDRPCYGPGQPLMLSGSGYTPSGEVALTTGGRQLGIGSANAAGVFSAVLRAPTIGGRTRTDRFVATDQTDLAVTATALVRLTSLRVAVRPKQGNPGRRRRIEARGFTTGRTLYAHIRRGDVRRNVRIGRLKGPCGTLSAKRRLLSPDAPSGVYRVQFDSRRRYSATTAPQVAFLVTVYRTNG